MFRNECVGLDSFKNPNIKITCRVDECTRLIERMMNYDELFENDQSIQKIRTSHYSAKLLRLPPIIGRFYTRDALPVWTSFGKHFVIRPVIRL